MRFHIIPKNLFSLALLCSSFLSLHAQSSAPTFEGKILLHGEKNNSNFGAVSTQQKLQFEKKIDWLQASFEAFDLIEFTVSDAFRYISGQKDSIIFQIQIGEKYKWRVKLLPTELRGEGYQMRIVGTEDTKALSRTYAQTYEGIVDEPLGGEVKLTVDEGLFNGYFTYKGEKIFIENYRLTDTEATSEQLLLYKETDVLQNEAHECKVMGGFRRQHTHEPIETFADCDEGYELEIAAMAQHSLYNLFEGNIQEIENYIISTFNNSQGDYERFNIKFKLVELLILKDPESEFQNIDTDVKAVLSPFRSWGPSNFTKEYDVAVSFLDGPGSGTVGIAYLGVICTGSRYCVVDKLRNASSDRVLLSHELGHNFNADHTNGPYIMAPSVNQTSAWANRSVNSIENHISTRSCLACFQTPPSSIRVKVQTYLEGFWNGDEQNMVSELRTNELIPKEQPFASYGYQGEEKVDEIPDFVLDWILIELRSSSNPSEVLQQRAGWLSASGKVYDLDADEGILFEGIIPGDYYIAIRARAHLPVISANPVDISPDMEEYTFSSGTDKAKGIDQLKMQGNVYVQYAGDYDGNGLINNADFNLWKQNSAAFSVYLFADGDANGILNNLDYNLWKINRSKVADPALN